MTPYARAQLDIAAFLNSLDYCADIEIVLWRPRTKLVNGVVTVETAPVIQSKIDLALAGLTTKGGKSGLCATVLMPVVTVPEANATGLASIVATSIRLMERPLINMGTSGTLKPCEDAAWEIANELKGYFFGHAALFEQGNVIEPVLDPTDTSGNVIYNVEVQQKANNTLPDRCARPSLAASGLTLTLACATEGAAIYYTTDESFPGPNEPTATEYGEPFAVTSGTYLRVAAFKTGKSPSPVHAQLITA